MGAVMMTVTNLTNESADPANAYQKITRTDKYNYAATAGASIPVVVRQSLIDAATDAPGKQALLDAVIAVLHEKV